MMSLNKTHFELLAELCLSQKRGIYLSAANNYVSIIITHPESIEHIAYSMGCLGTVDNIAKLMLDNLKSTKLKLVE